MVLDTGVIGTGTVARNNHLPAVDRNPRTRLVAVCDADGERAREVGFEYAARPYVEAESMLDTEDLDWVHIATPVGTHRDLAGLAIETGIPTTIQKPATTTLAELEELQALADQHEIPISVVHNWLYYPIVRRVRRRLREGDLGPVRAVETTVTGEGPPDETYRGSWVFDLPGGEFEEGMPHPLYLTLVTGGHPSSFEAVDVRVQRVGEYDRDMTYDGVTLQYETGDGALCSVTFLAESARGQEMRIHCEEGSLRVDLPSRSIREYDPDAGPYHFFEERLDRNLDDLKAGVEALATTLAIRARERFEERFDYHLDDSPDGHYYLLDEIATALERGEQPPLPLERSRWTVGLMEQVRERAREAPDQSPR